MATSPRKPRLLGPLATAMALALLALPAAPRAAAGPELPAGVPPPPMAPSWCDDQNSSNAVDCVAAFTNPLPFGGIAYDAATKVRTLAYGSCRTEVVEACSHLSLAEKELVRAVHEVEEANAGLCREWPPALLLVAKCPVVGPAAAEVPSS